MQLNFLPSSVRLSSSQAYISFLAQENSVLEEVASCKLFVRPNRHDFFLSRKLKERLRNFDSLAVVLASVFAVDIVSYLEFPLSHRNKSTVITHRKKSVEMTSRPGERPESCCVSRFELVKLRIQYLHTFSSWARSVEVLRYACSSDVSREL